MKRQVMISIGAVAALCSAYAAGDGFSLSGFREPSMECRPVPLWFWNNDNVEAPLALEQFRSMVSRDGYGGCAILPFGGDFRPGYLSDGYFSLYGSIIEEARRCGAQMSVYDEYGFPSGSMGAINGDGIPRFMERHPDATVKRLDKVEYDAGAGKTCFLPSPSSGALRAALDEAVETCDVEFGPGQELRYIHKTVDGKDVYYFANLRQTAIQSVIRLRGKVSPLLLDPHSGETSVPEYRYEKDTSGRTVTVVSAGALPLHSFFIVQDGLVEGVSDDGR